LTAAIASATIQIKAAARSGASMLLTKHEGVTFKDQTIYISGQAFVRCQFIGCTLVLRETVKFLEGCSFERCNWHVDWVLMWGSPESLQEIKGLITLIERAQQMQLPPSAFQKVGPGGSVSPDMNPQGAAGVETATTSG
jgi:hypothetical protein